MTEIRDKRHAAWFWVDKCLIDEYGSQIGAYGVALYAVLARFADAKGHAHPSLTTMAKMLKVSKNTVIRTMDTLCTHGLVEKSARQSEHGDSTTNIYILLHITGGSPEALPGSPEALPGSPEALPGSPEALQVVHHRHYPGSPQAPPISFLTRSIEQDPIEQEKTPPTPSPEKRSPQTPKSVLAGFEAFWSAYPAERRVDKKACLAKWKLKGLETRATELAAHVASMRHSKQWQEGKIPNTTTYLNQERWETPPPGPAKAAYDPDGFLKYVTPEGHPR